jgi:hypothetical protein
MKKVIIMLVTCQLLLLAGCRSNTLTPKQEAKKIEYTTKIEKPDLTFRPTTARTMGGRSINVNYSYSMRISKDTIDAYLPYFGRSYTAPTDPSQLGIRFVSTDFVYTSEVKKNGSYDIKIEPKDISNTQLLGLRMYFNVSNSGYGNLNVQFTNRQSISFYGTIE